MKERDRRASAGFGQAGWRRWVVAGLLVLIGCLLTGSARAAELRTWTDSTGAYTLKAKFVSLTGKIVTLETEDGERMEIELSKLSKEDQDYVAKAGASPFKRAESPFKRSMQPEATPQPSAATEPEMPAEPRTVEVDWSQSLAIPLTAPSESWKVELADQSDGLGFRPRTVALPPKRDFFDGMKGLAVNAQAKKAVVGYVLGRPGGDGGTRVVLCDLEAGRTIGKGATAPGNMVPIALHDDGRQVVMRRSEFGFGKQDRLEIWVLRGSQVAKSLIWTPYDDARGGDRDVLWAEFLDGEHLATSSRGGKVAIWRLPAAEPVCHFQLSGGAVPALSLDRKLIAFCSNKTVGLFDVERREVVAATGTPRDLQWPYMAFSPSGLRLGCIAFNSMLVWDATSGELQRDIPCTGINVHGAIAYPHDDFLLGGNKFLVDLVNQLKLWQYHGAEQTVSVGGWTFMGVSNGDKRPGALLPLKIPHAGAKDLLEKALRQPDLFVFRPGTRVRLNVARIEPSQQQQVATALTRKLAELNCQVAPNGTIELVAYVEGPKQREVRYMHSGTYQVQEYLTKLAFVYQGQTVWQTQSSNVPGIMMLKRGENIENKLRASERPGYSFYENVELPKFLQKPTGQGPNSGQTIGTSKVTVSGIE